MVATSNRVAFAWAASVAGLKVTEAGRTLFTCTSGNVGQAIAFAGSAMARSVERAVWIAVAFYKKGDAERIIVM